MFERFSDRARQVLVLAEQEARHLGHDFVGTEHILLGLLADGEGLAALALESLGVSLEAVRDRVREAIGPVAPSAKEALPFTPRAKRVLELSLREALEHGDRYIGTEHLLLGLVREGDGVAAQVLADMGAGRKEVEFEVMKQRGGSPQPGAPPPRTRSGMLASRAVGRGRNLLAVAMETATELERLGEAVAALEAETARLRAVLAAHGIDPGVAEGGGAGEPAPGPPGPPPPATPTDDPPPLA